MSGVNETRFFVQYQLCWCEWKLNESVCTLEWKWSHDECRWECKELNDCGSPKNDSMWNSGTCDCEINKTCKIYEYFRY